MMRAVIRARRDSMLRRIRARERGSRRVAVLCDHPFVDTLPMVREPVLWLAEEGFEVELLAPEAWYWSSAPRVRYLPLRRPAGAPLQTDARTVGSLALRGLLGRDYELVLATPVASLILAAALAELWRAPLAVISDEVYSRDDWMAHPGWRTWMYRAHARAQLTIVPDIRRRQLLERDCPALAKHRFVELPNSPSGQPQAVGRNELRQRLGLPEGNVLLLNAGSFLWQNGASECLRASRGLPDGATLVFQANRPFDPATAELTRLAEAGAPVCFRLDPLPYDRVDEVIGACDVGIAFYRSPEPNYRLCGKGSGKVARYLRAGKPVIVDRGGGLEWVAEAGAGEIADDADGVPAALARIMADYGAYARAARRCHAEHWSFERHWPAVREVLDELMSSRRHRRER